jgi:beta-lactamase class A
MLQRSLFLLLILLTACGGFSQTLTPAPGTARPTGTALPMATLSVTPTLTLTPAATPYPTGTMTDLRPALQTEIDSVLRKYPADWHILVKRVGGEALYSRQLSGRIDVASVIKIPIALLFFKLLERQNLLTLKDYLAVKGIDGRTFEQLLHAMLVKSEEDATLSILKAVTNSRLDVTQTLRSWGAARTDIYYRTSTLEDMAALMEGLYAGKLSTPEARTIILTYMAEYTETDETRIGVIHAALPCTGHFYNKRGTITKEYLVVADMAIVDFPTSAGKQAYLIGMFAYPGDGGITYEALVQGMETLTPVFWQAIKAENSLMGDDGCNHP